MGPTLDRKGWRSTAGPLTPTLTRWGQCRHMFTSRTRLWDVGGPRGPQRKPTQQTWGDCHTALSGLAAGFHHSSKDVTAGPAAPRCQAQLWGSAALCPKLSSPGLSPALTPASQGSRAADSARHSQVGSPLPSPRLGPMASVHGSPVSRGSAGPWPPARQKLRKLIR